VRLLTASNPHDRSLSVGARTIAGNRDSGKVSVGVSRLRSRANVHLQAHTRGGLLLVRGLGKKRVCLAANGAIADDLASIVDSVSFSQDPAAPPWD